ncbi:haloacid dehalogenase-like hydrolase [Pseudobutyrivibrio sp. YE44]|uniref:haloacid dehalogenase-like hydrolase n=1 Tax=Pseudobutyrivibrio sp. YE44 TaxID=1520802 RepID=UPI0008838EA7|nr:HAD family hydrolase [Pseudobutyrivibrio sp. YE44]SDB33276.1 haloacid dehalogenase-like hydrolase [Pseudobutyrivibrio sp. YE44]
MNTVEKSIKAIKVLALCAVITISTFSFSINAKAEGDPLSLWTEGSASKAALVDYMNDITNEASPNFIPIQDRVAVFDLDGTLFCETDPVYFDHMLLQHRVLEDPTYKYKATDFEKEVANKVIEFAKTGKYPAGMDNDHGKAVASAFSGMTVDEFTAYIIKYRNTPANGYKGMTKGDAFYKPMVELIRYLQSNGFTTYIVSGTDRLIVRGLVMGKLPILPRNIIGSDETIVSNNQADADGLDYVFTEKDNLVLGGNFVVKNLKMNKVSVIAQEIGQQPVLSFGNSTGDSSMAEYVTSNNKYRSLAFMVCCDDTVRENGKLSSAEKMYGLCQEFNWVPISMKNDWTTIYGDGVTRK